MYLITNYRAIIIFIALFIMNFFIVYPGGMTPDSVGQFCQSMDLNFDNHHPPLMSMLWFLLNRIYVGPQLLLFFHLLLLWSGAALMYFANTNNRFKILYFVLPLLPMISSQSGLIWKDVGFGCTFFFVVATSYFIARRPQLNKSAAWVIIIFLSTLLFYGMSVKFQGKFVMPILFFYIFSSFFGQKIFQNIVLTIIFSTLLISLNSIIMRSYSTNSNSWQLKYIFDLAAIAQMLDDDSVMPEYVKQQDSYDFQVLKNNFTHKWVDPLIFPEDKIYNSVSDPKKLEQLQESYTKATTQYQFLYLKHRLYNLIYLLKSNYSRMHISITPPKELCEKYNIHKFEENKLNKIFSKIISCFPKFLGYNFYGVLLAIFCFYLQFSKTDMNLQLSDKHLLLFVALFSFVLISILMFFTMASDYRYLFIIRLITLFTIPILLNRIFVKRY